MIKAIKNTVRLAKLKRRLIKEEIYFNPEGVEFAEKNILIVDEIIPEKDKDSGSRRLVEIIKLLIKNDVKVFLMADYRQHRYGSEYMTQFEEMGVHLYKPAIYNGNVFKKEDYIKFLIPNLDFAWLFRPAIFDKFYPIFSQEKAKKVKLFYDMVDFHYIRMMREYDINPNKKLKLEAEKILDLEIKNCKNADVVVAISEADKNSLLPFFSKEEKIRIIGNIHQYQPKTANFRSFKDRKDLLFVGNFRHAPNVDAVIFLHDEIMPIVWQEQPDLKVKIVGSYVTEEISALNKPNFEIVGFVEDLDTFFENVRLFVAPLRYGAGIKGKIGQSFEFSVPVLTTTVGKEGFDFGQNEKYMVADTPENFAKNIIELYFNESLWNEISDNSDSILEPFSIDFIEHQMKDMMEIKG